MNTRNGMAIVVLACASLTGCVREDGMVRKDTIGSMLGAVAGGLVGAQFGSGTGQLLATTLGTFAGSMIGSEIGEHLDKEDRKAMQAAANRALNAGLPASVNWSNPTSGRSGSLRPVSDGTPPDGCRALQHTANLNGRRISEVQRWCLGGSDEWQFKEVVPS